MKVTLNKDSVELPAGSTILDLLIIKGLNRPGIAAAIDNILVPRNNWDSKHLAEGASVTVIQAVCGG